MVVSCKQVWSEISGYVDGEGSPEMRTAIAEHVRNCQPCQAVLAGTRNVIQVYGDERMFQVPAGYSQRMHRRLDDALTPRRGTWRGWLVLAAAGALTAAGLTAAYAPAFTRPEPRSLHSRDARDIPPGLTVLVAEGGKTFHVPGCTYIHDKEHLRTLTSREAMAQGYAPCVRCLKQYLSYAPGLRESQGYARLASLLAFEGRDLPPHSRHATPHPKL